MQVWIRCIAANGTPGVRAELRCRITHTPFLSPSPETGYQAAAAVWRSHLYIERHLVTRPLYALAEVKPH